MIKNALARSTYVIVLTVALLNHAHAISQLFWTNPGTNSIFRSNPDGTNVRKIVDVSAVFGAGSYFPNSITAVGDKIYWNDILSGDVYSANADGTQASVLIDSATAVPSLSSLRFNGGLSTNGSSLFFTGSNRFFSADLDGSNFVNHGFLAESGDLDGVVVGNQYFQANTNGGFASIFTYDLDGSNGQELIDMHDLLGTPPANDILVRGITSDGTYIYWSIFTEDAVYRAELDGSNPTELFSNNNAYGVTTDGGTIITSSFQSDDISATNIDGSNTNVIVQTANFGGSGVIADLLLADVSAVPEPSTYAAVLGGFALVWVACRRRFKN